MTIICCSTTVRLRPMPRAPLPRSTRHLEKTPGGRADVPSAIFTRATPRKLPPFAGGRGGKSRKLPQPHPSTPPPIPGRGLSVPENQQDIPVTPQRHSAGGLRPEQTPPNTHRFPTALHRLQGDRGNALRVFAGVDPREYGNGEPRVRNGRVGFRCPSLPAHKRSYLAITRHICWVGSSRLGTKTCQYSGYAL